MTRLLWVKNGEPVPKGHRLLQVLAHEERPDFGMTTSTRWILCELEILDSYQESKP